MYDLSFVNNQVHGPYVRAPRGTYKPAVLNDKMQANADRTSELNKLAKTIYDELKKEPHDQALWSRLLKLFFKSASRHGKVTPESLLGLECNLSHKTETILGDDYTVTASPLRKKLHIVLNLTQHPFRSDKDKKDKYLIRFIALFPDFQTYKCKREVVDSPLQLYTSDLLPIALSVPMPSTKSPFLLLISMRSYFGKADDTSAKENVLRIVAMG